MKKTKKFPPELFVDSQENILPNSFIARRDVSDIAFDGGPELKTVAVYRLHKVVTVKRVLQVTAVGEEDTPI